MNVFSKFAGAVALAACMTATSVAPANASLIININGGLPEVVVGTNTAALYASPFFHAAVPGFSSIIVSVLGADNIIDPYLMDSSIQVNSSGVGNLLIKITENGLTTAGAFAIFESKFSGYITGGMTVTRSIWLDPTNGGGEVILLASTGALSNSLHALAILSAQQALAGPFSITEKINISALASGRFLSADDSVSTVPELGSFALLALGLLSLFGFAMMRRRANA